MQRARSLVVFVTLLTVSACQQGPKQRKWSEAVVLEDGTSIVVDRYVQFNESNSWAGDAYSATETRSVLSFRDALATLPAWEVPLMPLVLYRDEGQWTVVATTTTCGVWAARGRPLPPYWEYRLVGTEWKERPLSKSSLGRKANLFLHYNPPLPARHITAEMKEQRFENAAEKYQRIQEKVGDGYCT